jgi:hypothetical protein
MFCRYCGHSIPEDANFCQVCGKRLIQAQLDDRYHAQSGPIQLPPSAFNASVEGRSPGTQHIPQTEFNAAIPSTRAAQNALLQPKVIVSVLIVIAMVCGLIVWIHNASSNVLYTADWSNGLSGWTGGGSQWSANNGMLSSDGTGCCGGPESIITAPYQLNGIANYIVEAQVQFLGFDQVCNGYSFGVDARMIPGTNGYEGGTNLAHGACDPSQADASLHVDNYTLLAITPFVPGTSWHTYDLEVNGNQLTLLIDGNEMLQATNDVHTTGGLAGIEDFNVQMNVSSFKIIAV